MRCWRLRREGYFAGNNPLQCFGIEDVFLFQNTGGQCLRGVVWHDWYTCLREDGPCIVLFIDKVNGNAAFFFSCTSGELISALGLTSIITISCLNSTTKSGS